MTARPSGSGPGAAVAAVRAHLRRRLALALLGWALGGVAAVGVLATAAAAAGFDPRWLPLLLNLLLIAVPVTGIFLWRAGEVWSREGSVVRSMEKAAGLPQGALLSALELDRAIPPGTSAVLARRASRSITEQLPAGDASRAGVLHDRTEWWVRAGLRAALLSISILVASVLLSPAGAADGFGGLVSPLEHLREGDLAPIEVTPGDAEVPRGTPVRIGIRAPGRTVVYLLASSPGELPREEEIALVDGEGEFELPGVMAPVDYAVRAPDGARSGRFRLDPRDPLLLSDLEVEAFYPPYTGLDPERWRGTPPELTIPAGTELRIRGTASAGLRESRLVPGDSSGDAELLRSDGRGFTGRWIPPRSGEWELLLEEEGGPTAGRASAARFSIRLVADSVPGIRIVTPGVDTTFPSGLRQPLVIEVSDDYGIGGVELEAWRISASGERSPPVVVRLPVGGTRGALLRPILDASRWGLLPRDTVRYFARAVDNAPAPQTGRSAEYRLTVPTAGEIRREVGEELSAAGDRVEALAEEAERRAEELRALTRAVEAGQAGVQGQRGGRPPALDFAASEEMRTARTEGESIAAAVDSLRTELARMARDLSQAGVSDPGLAEDLRSLEDLLERMQGFEAEGRDPAPTRGAPEDPLDDLRRMLESGEALRDQLGEAVEPFARAAIEQDWRATRAEAAELALQQGAVAEALAQGDDPELRAEQEDRLSEAAEELAGRASDLADRMEEAGEVRSRDAAREAAARAESAAERMREAAGQARAGAEPEAAASAAEGAQALQEALESLEGAEAERSEERNRALVDALRSASRDALALARRQTQIREAMPSASAEGRAGLRGDQQAIFEGVLHLARNLASAPGDPSAIDREISEAMGQALAGIQESMDALGERSAPIASAMTRAESAVRDLNRSAMRALDQARRISAGEGGQGSSAESPVSEALEAIARKQSEVNQQTGSLLPLQMGSESMQGTMEQIAQGQDAVAGELGSLASQPGAAEESLGDLEALAEEARGIAEDLQGGRMTPETLQRQERLFQRLLDAGRTLEKEGEEESEDREGISAGEFDRVPIQSLTPEMLGRRYRVPGDEDLGGLSAGERQRVLRYFERLNRGSTGASPAPPEGGR